MVKLKKKEQKNKTYSCKVGPFMFKKILPDTDFITAYFQRA